MAKKSKPEIRIEFLKDYRCFKKSDTIRLPLNNTPILLAGDQGTGKSTLLSLLARDRGIYHSAEIVRITGADTTVFHDFEKGNVRGAAAFGMGSIDDLVTEVQMLNLSHGEANAWATKFLFGKFAAKAKADPAAVLLLDEPDTGLSVRTAGALGRALIRIAANGYRVIVSVHNPLVLMSTAMVYDMELRKMVNPAEFVDRMLIEGKSTTDRLKAGGL